MPDYETILDKEEADRARFEQFLAELEKFLEEWRQTRADVSAIEQTCELLNDIPVPAFRPA